MALRYNEFNPYYSFGGALTFSKDKDKVLEAIPSDRWLLETDCPYMTPAPHRGKLNEPKYVHFVAAKMAELTGKSQEEIAELTTANAQRLFRRLIIDV
jgi:TatD DNase family protein